MPAASTTDWVRTWQTTCAPRTASTPVAVIRTGTPVDCAISAS
jgi:hypothetical protein